MWIRPFLRTSVIVALLLGIVPAAQAAPRQATTGAQTFRSKAALDGQIKEDGEKANVGGSKISSSPYVYVGDTSADEQVRTILSFDTSALPNNAIVTKAVLRLVFDGMAGGEAFSSLGDIMIYVREGDFGSSASLQLADWGAPASVNAGSMDTTLLDGAYKTSLHNAAEGYINLTGNTQIRLQFQTQDNDDATTDGIYFISGDHPTKSIRPLLKVEYVVP